MRFCRFFLFFAAVFWIGTAAASIVSMTGDVVESAPNGRTDVAQVSLIESRTTLFEITDLPLTFPSFTPVTALIPVGTSVNWYLFNYSPDTLLGSANGTVTFDGVVLGIINNDLERSDVPGYPHTADVVSISPDFHTVSFSLNVNSGSDSFELFVSNPVSEPTTLALAFLGLVGCCVGRSSSRK